MYVIKDVETKPLGDLNTLFVEELSDQIKLFLQFLVIITTANIGKKII